MHLENCLKDLREDFCNGQVPFHVTEPVVQYRETITGSSERQIMAKSANKHNRLYFESTNLSDAVLKAIEDKEITHD